MVPLNQGYRLGDLISNLKVLNAQELADALNLATDTGMPLGQVLVLSGFLSNHDMTNLLRCQTLLRENLLDIATAMQAIRKVLGRPETLDNALYELGWDPIAPGDVLALGDLLSESGVVSPLCIKEALSNQQKTNLPLGTILVRSEDISEALLTTALNIQVMIREGKLSKESGTRALRESLARENSKDGLPAAKGFYELQSNSAPRIGDLLVISGFVSENQLTEALEQSLLSLKPIGEVLIEQKLLTRNELDSVLYVQAQIARGELKLADAKTVLTAIRNGRSLLDAYESIGNKPNGKCTPAINFDNFLMLLGLLTEPDLDSSFSQAKRNPQVVRQVLTMSGVLDELTLERAMQCHNLHKEGLEFTAITTLFNYSQSHGITVNRGMKELHITLPSANAPNPKAKHHLAGVKDHLDPATLDMDDMRNLVNELKRKGDLNKALETFMNLANSLRSMNDNRYRFCLENLIDICTILKDFQGAEVYTQSLVNSTLSVFGERDPRYFSALNSLGKLFYFQGRLDEAIKQCQKYITLCTAEHGSGHPDVACGWQNIGMLYMQAGDLKSARNAYTTAFNICLKTLGQHHPATATIQKKLIEITEPAPQARNSQPQNLSRLTGSWRTIKLGEDFLLS